jgi:uncharacterized protein (UPF0210 family)
MQVRAITLGLDAAWPLRSDAIGEAGHFLQRAAQALDAAGVVVQTTRLATQPAHRFLAPAELADFARAFEAACADAGIPYGSVGGISLGPSWTEEAAAAAVADAIGATERTFSSIQIAGPDGLDYRAVRAAAAVISTIAGQTADGFGNLRFAAAAQCPPNIPFFPAAFHAGGPSRFSIAAQAAGEVVTAFSQAGTLEEAEARLVRSLEESGGAIQRVAEEIERATGVSFAGIDLSPAPFPVDEASAAGGLEALGLARFGGAGSVFASWRLTSAVKRTRLKQCGFSGLMMPVLEDTVLARRAAEGLLSVNDLLLCSTICGTGLDTVPLPGDVTREEIAGILLDVATLATALKKPLTARLFPIPGKRAGDPTEFEFGLFVNSRVLEVSGHGAARLLERALGERGPHAA